RDHVCGMREWILWGVSSSGLDGPGGERGVCTAGSGGDPGHRSARFARSEETTHLTSHLPPLRAVAHTVGSGSRPSACAAWASVSHATHWSRSSGSTSEGTPLGTYAGVWGWRSRVRVRS